MDDSSDSREALPLLGEVYRLRRTGVFSLESPRLGLVIRDGQVAGFCPPPGPRPVPKEPMPGPEDSTRLKLERVLAEVGLRKRMPTRPKPVKMSTDVAELRERLVAALANGDATATFEETTELPTDAIPTTGGIEPLILEALHGLEDTAKVRRILGDLDQRLVATAALAEQQRTLTLTEGYLLSRIDGLCTSRQILQLVPLQPDEAETTLAGLLLTGRVTQEAGPAPKPRVEPRTAPAPKPEAAKATRDQSEGSEEDTPTAPATTEQTPVPAGSQPGDEDAEEGPGADVAPATPEQTAERHEILEVFQSLPLRNHYEVLGVERRCSDADLKRAHVTLIKRYHPDMRREAHLEDLHDVLEAIFIRVGEAWDVLGTAKSRAAYEQHLGRAPHAQGGDARETPAEGEEAAPRQGPDPDEILRQAQLLLGKRRYWDAIQMLETAMPQLESQEHQHGGRILLARAYANNPKWVHRAVETLQGVLSEDPKNANAYYELGMLYKTGGLTARAEAMFRKALDARPGHKRAAAELPAKEEPAQGGLLRRLFGGGSKSG